MNTRANGLREVLVFFVLFMLVFLLHLRLNPAGNIIGQEGGVYFYSGQRILRGEVLYRDIWDYHLPAQHYLNALTMQLAGKSPWSIWWIEVVSLSAAGYLLSKVLRFFLSSWSVMSLMAVFFLSIHHPELLSSINFSEASALLPQIAAIYCFAMYLIHRQQRWVLFLGIASGIAFLFNPPSSILGIAGLPVLTLAQRGNTRSRIALAGLVGWISPLIVVVGLWITQGSLGSSLQVLTVSNAARLSSRLSFRSLYAGLRQVASTYPLASLFILAIGGAFSQLGKSRSKGWHVVLPDVVSVGEVREPASTVSSYGLGWVIVLALPIEILMVSLTGQNHGHNFLVLFPSMIIGSGLIIERITFQPTLVKDVHSDRRILAGMVSVVLAAWIFQTVRYQKPEAAHMNMLLESENWDQVAEPPVLDFIYAQTEYDDPVLVWGSDIEINYLSGRATPSRFLSPTAAFETAEFAPGYLKEYIHTLMANPARLVLINLNEETIGSIFDTAQTLCPGCGDELQAEIMVLKDFYSQHYAPVESIENWEIYQWRD